MCNSSRKNQLKRAIDIHIAAGVDTSAPVPLTNIKQFEDALDAQILVLSATRANAFIYTGSKEREKKYFLYLTQPTHFTTDHPGHYHAVTNITGFLGKSYFCNHCLRPYKELHGHKCAVTCDKCKSNGCKAGTAVKCADCNGTFRSDHCFKAHKEATYYTTGKNKGALKKRSICSRYILTIFVYIGLPIAILEIQCIK